jgi:AmmeMemoRadiSam system protein B
MSTVRSPAVAGFFYPGDARELEAQVRGFLADAAPGGRVPKALVAPHAGYVYSGPVAATGYRRLEAARERIERVVLLGPAHRYPLRGLAAHGADFFETPLGRIRVDPEVRSLPHVEVLDAAHRGEHSLEVHLPFLQIVLGDFTVAPLVVGDAPPDDVAEVLDALWGGPETVIVVSSDLSHFHDYATAQRLDRETADAIVGLRYEDVGPYDACGCRGVSGLLAVARRRGLRIEEVDLRNSGDTAGSHDRVVGYGTFLVFEE